MIVVPMTAADLAAIARAPRNVDRMAELTRLAAAAALKEAKERARSVPERIADDMIDIGEGCTREDLIHNGWKPAVLDKHATDANRIARERAGDAR